MTRDEALEHLRQHESVLRERFGVNEIMLFGSVARNEAREDSDIDLVVAFDGPATLNRFAGLVDYLEEVFGRRVDLATADSVHPALRRAIQDPFVPREWRFLVERMMDGCRNVREFTAGLSQSTFIGDRLAYDATLRNLETIARAATAIPQDIRDTTPSIDWTSAISIGELVTYRAEELNDDAIWHVIQEKLPVLERELDTFLATHNEDGW